ncbi:ribosome small subunit-dependent GTPase A [Oceaniglobus indicus]|uniref:ribosome small subunit-dependent GTPase A n=1 Tax=Oceaniglobus indicus TaxID=2047749 RepID=UPI000C17B3E0|nr:ribosome small subunit-dependent GTPase A [Oceaniglobus indicus]
MNPDAVTLAKLGWTDHFADQCEASESSSAARLSAVSRDDAIGLTPSGPRPLVLPGTQSAADYAVGDWVILHADTGRILRRLARTSVLRRRAAGTGRAVQLIAANIDTLFIVSSCNDDFNPARLERYLVLAAESGIDPVILLTKADRTDDPANFVNAARALAADLPVAAVNAKNPATADLMAGWLGRGRTGALLGSSGVGKTTLLNAMTGGDAATGEIREDDARGRHTTTARGLFAARGGAWLVDTPGMRAIRLADVGDGIDAVFSDISDLAAACRFSDCAHQGEPGCAVQAALADGTLPAARLDRWRKLKLEEADNTTLLQRARRTGRRRR